MKRVDLIEVEAPGESAMSNRRLDDLGTERLVDEKAAFVKGGQELPSHLALTP
jgi:hypothetical protein